MNVARLFLPIVAWLVLVTHAAAQRGQDARITGKVVDATGAALVGAVLSVESPQLIGGALTTVSDEEGHYDFLRFPPGTYRLRASLPGFTTREHLEIVVLPGSTIAIDFRLEVAPLENTVSVLGGISVIDVRSSSSPTLIGRTMLDNLPLDRNVAGYVNLAPGVAMGIALGGSALANPVAVDGASGNEPGWGTPSAPLTRNWLEEIQIVGPGADSEYGGFTGVVLNGITRSGSNRFDGLGEYWATRQSWTDNNRGRLPPALATQFRPLEVFERWDASGQVGGPVRRDHLWFFTGTTHYRDVTRSAAFTALPRDANEPRVSISEQRQMVKLTAAPAGAIRLDGFFSRNTRDAHAINAGPLVRPEAIAGQDRRDLWWNIRMRWSAGTRTVVEAQHGGNDRNDFIGPPPERRDGPSPRQDQLTGLQSGNTGFFQDWRSRVSTSSAAVTHLRAMGRGRHEIKAGIEHEWSRLKDRRGIPSNRIYLDVDGAPDLVQLWDGASYRGNNTQTGVYLQDTWTLAAPITINGGARFNVYRASPPYQVDYATESFAPRIGIAWDIGGEHRTVLRVNVGRSHDPMVTSYYDFLDPLSHAPNTLAREVAPGKFEEVSRILSVAEFEIDPEIRQSYVQESLISLERALGSRMTLKGEFIYRIFGDTVSFVDTSTHWTPVDVPDPGPDGRAGTIDDPGSITIFANSNVGEARRVMTNPPQAYKNHRAAQVVFTRRDPERWSAQASYTWSQTRANYQNAFSSNAANNDNSINSVFANPNRAINNNGETAFSLRHALKAFGSARVPWLGGWRVSGIYRLESGLRWGRIVVFSGLPQGFEVVRTQPPVRKGDMIQTADLRVEKSIAFGASAMLGIFADVFNVANAGAARFYTARSGPNFGLPQVWIEPRVLRLGGRVTF